MQRVALLISALVLLSALLFSGSGHSSAPERFQQQPYRINAIQYQLTTADMSASELVAEPALFHKFTPLTPTQNRFRVTEAQALWLLVRFSNPYPEPWEAIISYPFLPVDKISFYRIETDRPSVTLLSRTGSTFPFVERPLPLRSFSQPLRLGIGEHVSLLIKLEDAALLSTELRLSSLTPLLAQSQQQLQYDSLVAGAMLLFIVLAILRGYQQRQAALFHLAGFYVGFLLVLATLNGQAFSTLWPLYPEMNPVFIYISIGFCLVCLTLFNRFSLLRQVGRVALLLNALSLFFGMALLFSPLFASGPLKLKLLFLCLTLVLSITLLQALFVSLTTTIRYTPRFALLAAAATLQLLLVQIHYLAPFANWMHLGVLLLLSVSIMLLLSIPKLRRPAPLEPS